MDTLDADRLVLEATESKQILDAQFVDICSYWQLFSILDITRGRHKTPERILNVFRALSLTENSPVGQHGSSSALLLKAKASARSQALLNIKNIAMMCVLLCGCLLVLTCDEAWVQAREEARVRGLAQCPPSGAPRIPAVLQER